VKWYVVFSNEKNGFCFFVKPEFFPLFWLAAVSEMFYGGGNIA